MQQTQPVSRKRRRGKKERGAQAVVQTQQTQPVLSRERGAQAASKERGAQAAVQMQQTQPVASKTFRADMRDACIAAVFVWLIAMFLSY